MGCWTPFREPQMGKVFWLYRTLRAVMTSRRLRKMAQQCPFFKVGPLTDEQKIELGPKPYRGKATGGAV